MLSGFLQRHKEKVLLPFRKSKQGNVKENKSSSSGCEDIFEEVISRSSYVILRIFEWVLRAPIAFLSSIIRLSPFFFLIFHGVSS